MLYKLNPTEVAPYLVPGDQCEVAGHVFDYIDEVNNYKEIPPNKIGLFRLKDETERQKTPIYMLVHPRIWSSITRARQEEIFSQIAADNSIIEEPKIDRPDKNVFAPPIYPEDNELKVRIKQILQQEQIDIRDLRPKFRSDNHMNNLSRLIKNRGVELTWNRFLEWLDILGYSHQVSIYGPDGNLCTFESNLSQ